MQKLVTIYMDNAIYTKGKMFASATEKHGSVEEHLDTYLAEGWRIVTISAMGGAAENFNVRGWVVVLLEKGE